MIKQAFQVIAGALAFALWLALMVSVPIIASEMIRTSSRTVDQAISHLDD